jgi:hypothetical protein
MLPKLSLSFAVVLALTSAVLLGRIDAAGAVGVGGTCAGIAGLGCDAGLWCELEPGTCNRADAAGRCVHAPQSCGLSLRPVCACGGRTYSSDCQRQRAKAQKSHDGPCR